MSLNFQAVECLGEIHQALMELSRQIAISNLLKLDELHAQDFITDEVMNTFVESIRTQWGIEFMKGMRLHEEKDENDDEESQET